MSDAKVREVWPGIYIVHLPLPVRPTIVNVYLLHSGDEWVLVDTGVDTAESKAAFDTALAQIGCPPDGMTRVICTHHHPDHFGCSRAYRERSGARLYMNRLEYEIASAFGRGRRSEDVTAFFIRNGVPIERFVQIPSPAAFWSEMYRPATPDHFIEDGEVLTFGDLQIEVITTPGHTAGHCVLYLRRQRLLISGDHLLPKITPHVGFYPGGPENPLRDFLESQRKIQRFDVNLVLPAHGGTFPDHRHRANQIIHHHEYRLQEMIDAIRRQGRTAYEIGCLCFGFDVGSPLMVQIPATFETLAHLQYLHAQGRVVREDHGEQTLYRAT
ncbi:MAG: beta-lactamase domain protein [Deltaproteobacteria bacterium]|nr:beta-lactamase domain protein [Deltaproteobacteria bacterium]